MIFFNNNQTLILVSKNSLTLLHGGNKRQLQIPEGIFQNMEILDTEGFEKLLSDFLAGIKLKKQKVSLVLSKDLLFEKELTLDEKTDINGEFKKFLDSVVLSSDKIIAKNVQDKKRSLFFATNKRVIEEIRAVIEGMGWILVAVIPNLEDQKLSKLSDFLREGGEDLGEGTSSGLPIKIFLILLFLILILGSLFIFRGRVLDKLGRVVGGGVKVTTTEEKSSSPSPTIESTGSASLPGIAWERSDAQIQVLNGSGVSGQAARVRDILVELGYEEDNIELGNATGSGETVVIFSKKVPKKLQDEIIGKLEEIFADVTTQEEIEQNDFDILITTGRGV